MHTTTQTALQAAFSRGGGPDSIPVRSQNVDSVFMIARYRNRTSLCVAGMAAPDWATGCRACFKYIAEKLDNDFSRKKAWTHEAQRGRDGQHITGCPMAELKARGDWSKSQERAAMQDILEEERGRRAAGAPASPLARIGLLPRSP